ncbi:10696_t:CDS:2, partial [Gigaspora rosea]
KKNEIRTLKRSQNNRKINLPETIKAKDLTLWKANIPYTEEDIRWEDLILEDNKEIRLQKLLPIRKVSDVFVEEESITFSNKKFNLFLELTGLKIKNVSNSKITNDIDPYKWMSHAKNASNQRKKLLKHFKSNLVNVFLKTDTFGVSSNHKNLLTIRKSQWFPCHIKGGTDFILVDECCAKNKMLSDPSLMHLSLMHLSPTYNHLQCVHLQRTYRQRTDLQLSGIREVIELKKQFDHISYQQSILEMVAADMLVGDEIKVFAVLTDMSNWTIYWLDEYKRIMLSMQAIARKLSS